ncbi:hypothetical protein ACK9YZ_00700 [Rhizobium sp. ZK1]|uniref:hypothetical protein n=1 Tax=Rhizobium sp. ZK1 TaxID=3389872 RepID=UPI0039F6543D
MDIDEALNIAVKAQATLVVPLQEMTDAGIVVLLVAGTTGSAVPMDAYPTLGVHLSVERVEVSKYAPKIMELASGIIAEGVRVSVHPRPDSV